MHFYYTLSQDTMNFKRYKNYIGTFGNNGSVDLRCKIRIIFEELLLDKFFLSFVSVDL